MKKLKIFSNRFIFIIPLIVFLFLTVTHSSAQEEEPVPPPRNADREAPEREAVIVKEQETAGGANTIIEIPAIADTYIASEFPNQNFGDDGLYLGYNLSSQDPFGAERILIKFDVENNIPLGATINSAVIRLRLTFSSPPIDDPMGTVLRRLASPWNEDTVTWNTEPSWTPIDDVTYVGSELNYYDWDVTEEVEGWLSDAYPNNGIEIIGDETVQQRERAFYARETMGFYYPRLVVDYTLSNDQEAPNSSVEPLPQYSRRNFTVSWSGSDPGGSGIQYYDVQLRIDGGQWESWLSGVIDTEADYSNGNNGSLYEFRVRAVDNAGNVEQFGAAEASTTVDSLPPTSTIDPLPNITDQTSFTVSWTGSDSVSGIQYYDVQYRYNGGPWTIWLPQTLATSAVFQNADDGLYEFEVRAVDNLDQKEPFIDEAEATIVVDSEPPFIVPQDYLPIVLK